MILNDFKAQLRRSKSEFLINILNKKFSPHLKKIRQK